MDKAQIGIIMPCYYSSDIIRKALTMLSWQTRKDAIEIIMIDDCSPHTNCNYQDLREEFSNQLKIKYLKTDVNGGPGIARQLGINNCDCDWVMFHDDDDMLNNPFVIEQYLIFLNQIPIGLKDNIMGISGVHLYPLNFSKQEEILTGRLFNLNKIKQFNISFGDLRYEEDRYFLIQCYYYLSQNKNLFSVSISQDYPNFISYTKQNNNKNSICTSLSEQYKIHEALKMIEALLDFYEKNEKNDAISHQLREDYNYFNKWIFERVKRYGIYNSQQKQDLLRICSKFINLANFFNDDFIKEKINFDYNFIENL